MGAKEVMDEHNHLYVTGGIEGSVHAPSISLTPGSQSSTTQHPFTAAQFSRDPAPATTQNAALHKRLTQTIE